MSVHNILYEVRLLTATCKNSLNNCLDKLQRILEFHNIDNPQFKGDGLGKVGLTAFILGSMFGSSVMTSIMCLLLRHMLYNQSILSCLVIWCLYLSFLSGFHFLEFIITAWKQPQNASFQSFVVSHSKAYTLAASKFTTHYLFKLCILRICSLLYVVVSAIEFWTEYLLFGISKFHIISISIGILLLLLGQYIRTLAMITCGQHFSHVIQNEKSKTHKLIKHGIYKYLRHPSYFGWFYWSIGTQFLLCNPICILFYIYASWTFFNTRIPYEEDLLIDFYEEEYLHYTRTSIIGIPLIHTIYPSTIPISTYISTIITDMKTRLLKLHDI